MSMEWSNDYSVEHEKMDDQHKQLFDIINEYYEAVKNDSSFSSLKKVFDKVLAFTQYHFKEEEELLAKTDYPKLREHQLIHQNLVERVLELREDLNNEVPGSPDHVKYFLKNWLTSHIKGIDKQYSPFVNTPSNKIA